jgi:nucleotide-binding universal stress UspA family protein
VGHPGEAWSRCAREQQINLVVMGTVANSAQAGLTIGSTAERVLHSVTRSVLGVKPVGFASPVEPSQE